MSLIREQAGRRISFAALLILIAGCSGAYAQTAPDARLAYTQAQVALALKDLELVEALDKTLADYVLYPYLEYAVLRRNLATADESDLMAFSERYPDFQPATELKGQWLRAMGERGDWERFVAAYDGRSDTVLNCYYLRARIRNADTAGVAEEGRKIWLVGSSQPSACDHLFEWMETEGQLTADLIWQRFELAMANGELGLAKFLSKKLSESNRLWSELWIQAEQEPALALRSPLLAEQSDRARKVMDHGLRRMARLDPALAKDRFEQLAAQRGDIPAEQKKSLARYIVLRAAIRGLDQAPEWLAALPERDAEVTDWLARLALAQKDWNALISVLAEVGIPENKWQYWLARAYQETQQPAAAQVLFQRLAQDRSYYAFLAADELGIPYSLNHKPFARDAAALANMVADPRMARAQELYLIGQLTDARREWNRVRANMNPAQLMVAAQFMSDLGWHGEAIRAVGEAGALDDLDIRFPLVFNELFDAAARKHNLDPSLLRALSRRESGYDPSVRSSANALGLTQVLPGTASNTARKLGQFYAGEDSLKQPATNLNYGADYLREQLDAFGGHAVLALAAYNAGPKRPENWLAQIGDQPADFWVDQIPFKETRDYVQNVLAYAVIYDLKTGVAARRLKDRMPPISASLLSTH